MSRSLRHSEPVGISFHIPIAWDGISARSLFYSTVILCALLLLVSTFEVTVDKREFARNDTTRIELMEIKFGRGNGKGASRGDLIEEGATRKGDPTKQLAQQQSTNPVKGSPTIDANQTNTLIAKNNVTNSKNTDSIRSKSGTQVATAGVLDGVQNATGKGKIGTGEGKGVGLGNVDWGGGGNRIVLYKPMPKYPDGQSGSPKLRFRIVVSPEGSIVTVTSLDKGEPAFETASMNALRKWQFNKIDSPQNMVGVITFSFQLR
jgi:hypothetical protein